MSVIAPLRTIPVGIVVERSKGAGPWTDVLLRPFEVLVGVPETPVGTTLSDDGERATFYAGAAEIELYRSEAGNYRENLMVEQPLLWVALRPGDSDPPCVVAGVTVDPAEGEGWAGQANDDIVEALAMPPSIEQVVASFVSEHYVEQAFRKRKRDRADPEALARRPPRPGERS